MAKGNTIFPKDFLIVLGSMVMLSGFLTVLTSIPFATNLLFSVVIGLSCYAATKLVLKSTHKVYPDWKVAVIAMPVGIVLGVVIANSLSGLRFVNLIDTHPRSIVITLLISVVTASLMMYYFYSRGVIAETELRLKQKTLEKILYEQTLAESELRLLQAQIEPHFLFNTLSNILSLVHDEPQKAEKMLENLSDCLRASLRQTRSSRISIREELDLVRAYLEIQKVRMEERLAFQIEMDSGLQETPIPPLLIQPIVENAVKHGLEPKKDGGAIVIRITQSTDMDGICISVADNGVGCSGIASDGLGLANTVKRLKATYRESASLTLLEKAPKGVEVVIQIPKEIPGNP